MTEERRGPRRPIGFWLKLVDRRLEEGLDEVLAAAGLTRRGWQALNAIRDGATSTTEVAEALLPFLHGDPVDPVLDQLLSDGWVDGDGGLGLTESGTTRYDDLIGQVTTFRRSVMTGISDEEYATTLGVLQRAAVNLGWTDDAEDETE